MSNSSDGHGTKPAHQPQHQQVEGEDMELIEEDNLVVPSWALDNAGSNATVDELLREVYPLRSEPAAEKPPELKKLPQENIVTTAISSRETTCAIPVIESSPQTYGFREQIRELCNNKKPLVKKLEKYNDITYVDRLILYQKDFGPIILPVLNKDERDKIYGGVDVDVYDEILGKYAMKPKKLPASQSYILTGEWRTFYKEFNLKPNEDAVKLWVFRHYGTRRLRFYIEVSQTKEPETEKAEVSASPEGPSNVLELEEQVRLLREKTERRLDKQMDESDTGDG